MYIITFIRKGEAFEERNHTQKPNRCHGEDQRIGSLCSPDSYYRYIVMLQHCAY